MFTHPIKSYRLAQLHQEELRAAANRNGLTKTARTAEGPVSRVLHLIGAVLVGFGTRVRGDQIDAPLGTTSPAAH